MRKQTKLKKILLVFVLIGALLGVQVMEIAAYAAETDTGTVEPNVIVSNYAQLESALKQAKDGDVIGVSAGIAIKTNVTIGSTDKHVTLKRMTAESYILVSVGKTTFVNVTFDGASLNSTISFLQSKYEMEANNVVFQNCTSNIGGAVSIEDGTATFTNCIFENNTAIAGGHLALKGNSNVIINQCTFTKGTAGNGGAIYVVSANAFCSVLSSVITENSAQDAGGGLANKGQVQIQGTKLYNNYATNGGYDIANLLTGITNLVDSTEELQTLFGDEFKINGWISDSSGVFIPDVDLSREDCLLKLDYEEIVEDPSEPSEPTDPGDTEDPDDTGGDATDPSEPSEGEDPDEPSTEEPDTDEDPTEPGTDDGDQDEPTDPSQPGDSDQGTEEPPSEPTTPTDPDDSQEPGDNITTDNSDHSSNDNSNTNIDNSSNDTTTTDKSDHSNIKTDNSVTNTNSGNTTNTTSDNSQRTEDNSSVTYNYYYPSAGDSEGQSQQIVIHNYIQGNNEDQGVSSSQEEKVLYDPMKNVSIDAEGVDVVFEVVDGVYSISIKAREPEQQVQQAAEEPATESFMVDWYEVIKIALLNAIVFVVKKK